MKFSLRQWSVYSIDGRRGYAPAAMPVFALLLHRAQSREGAPRRMVP